MKRWSDFRVDRTRCKRDCVRKTKTERKFRIFQSLSNTQSRKSFPFSSRHIFRTDGRPLLSAGNRGYSTATAIQFITACATINHCQGITIQRFTLKTYFFKRLSTDLPNNPQIFPSAPSSTIYVHSCAIISRINCRLNRFYSIRSIQI